MSTDELLEQVKKLFDAEREQTSKLVKGAVHSLREEIQASEHRVMQKIEGLTDDMAEYFHKTWEKMDETNERVTIIEDHLGLPHPTEN